MDEPLQYLNHHSLSSYGANQHHAALPDVSKSEALQRIRNVEVPLLFLGCAPIIHSLGSETRFRL